MKYLPVVSLLSAIALGCCVPASVAHGQPSGGPYGPLAQTYTVPTGAAHLYYVAPEGKNEASGAALAEPTSLESALAKVVTGDAVILRGGTYRTGNLVFNQGITIQPYADERPILKGTLIADKWESLREGIWRTSWKTLFPSKPRDWWQRSREGMYTPLHRFNNDMVFVDGEALRSVGWEGELDAHSYFINYEEGKVYLKLDPTKRLVEITAWDSALVRTSKPCHGKESDHQGPAIRGITFTQYAYRALEVEGKRGSVAATEEPTDDPVGIADPATFGKEVVGTTIEDCTITHCSRVGGYFRGDRLTIRRCLVSDTSTEGIYVIGSSDCLLEKNIFARNNVEQFTGYYPSSVKIFNQTRRVTFRDNLVIDQPNSNGVWYDVGNVDGVFVNNWIEGCRDGLFFEISKGVICAGNVFVNCAYNGTRILNSSNAQVYSNTYINSAATFERDGRSAVGDHFDWHPATGPTFEQRTGHVFVNNLMIADESFARELLRIGHPAAMKDKAAESQVKQVDGNVYVRRANPAAKSLIQYSPLASENSPTEYPSLTDLQKSHPQFESHSREFADYQVPVCRSLQLQRYELLREFAGTAVGLPLPDDVQKLLGRQKTAAPFPGAFAPLAN